MCVGPLDGATTPARPESSLLKERRILHSNMGAIQEYKKFYLNPIFLVIS